MAGSAPFPGTAAGITPVRRSTLGGDVYESLKALIMEHTLTPRDRVNIDAVARDLEVSPTPVREALARLESELHAHLHIHRLYFPYAQTGATSEEHQRIAAAITAGDPDAAEAAMRAHLSEARSRHLPAFD